MADVVNSIDSDVLVMSISTNIATPAYKEVVCTIDNGLHMTRDVRTQNTRCGTAKAGGSPNYTVDGSFAANTTPGSSEMSSDALIALADSGAPFLWKIAHASTPSNYFRSGTGFLSSYNETAADSDIVKGDFTIEVTSVLDLIP